MPCSLLPNTGAFYRTDCLSLPLYGVLQFMSFKQNGIVAAMLRKINVLGVISCPRLLLYFAEWPVLQIKLIFCNTSFMCLGLLVYKKNTCFSHRFISVKGNPYRIGFNAHNTGTHTAAIALSLNIFSTGPQYSKRSLAEMFNCF